MHEQRGRDTQGRAGEETQHDLQRGDAGMVREVTAPGSRPSRTRQGATARARAPAGRPRISEPPQGDKDGGRHKGGGAIARARAVGARAANLEFAGGARMRAVSSIASRPLRRHDPDQVPDLQIKGSGAKPISAPPRRRRSPWSAISVDRGGRPAQAKPHRAKLHRAKLRRASASVGLALPRPRAPARTRARR